MIGRTISHYRILEQIGSGGMGVVYKAEDTQLGRPVALKFLPAELTQDDTAKKRLVHEARAISALQHHNICTIHEIGESDDSRMFICMDYYEGETLKDRLARGPLSVEEAIDVTVQVAEGLEEAHSRGMLHRDVKPANVMVTKQEVVKILDFGLAKLTGQTQVTKTGSTVGTVAYMSPEQVTGEDLDQRSDIFSLGVMFYELLTGAIPFAADYEPAIMHKILNVAPPSLRTSGVKLAAQLDPIVGKMLAKEPDERYASARQVIDVLSKIDRSGHRPTRKTHRRPRVAWVLAAVGAVAILIWAIGRVISPPRPPTRTQLTSAEGAVSAARFAPDGRSVIYAADWGGKPYGLYSARPGFAEPRALGFDDAMLLAISPTEEMAVLNDFLVCPGPCAVGTLAIASPGGGSPKRMLEGVEWADWGPDGKELAVVRNDSLGRIVLEYPPGNPLYAAGGWLTHPRVSRKGDLVAFIEHPGTGDLSGSIAVVSRSKRRQTLTEGWKKVWGLAWSPSGKEVWFTGLKVGGDRALYAVSLSGKTRRVHEESSDFVLMDVHADGRALLVRQTNRARIVGMFPGDLQAREVPGLDYPLSVSLSDDGSTLLVQEVGVGGEDFEGSMYLLRSDGSPKVGLGHGEALALSPDGQWVLAKMRAPEPTPLVLIPTGSGLPRPLPRDSITRQAANWFPDGESFVFTGSEGDRGARTYVQSIHGGAPRPITPEGVPGIVLSPDGQWIAVPGRDSLYSTVGEPPRGVPYLADAGTPLAWAADGRSLFVEHRDVTVNTIFRFDLDTGDREFLMELVPPEVAGVVGMFNTLLTPDGKYYAYTYDRNLGDLYLFEGLK